MKLAINSYCYHRFFGEIYPGLETDPGSRMSVPDFIERARAHGVQGVAIEHFMLESDSPEHLAMLRRRLDEAGLERVWAWGHPRGLGSGTMPEALDDLKRNVDVARTLGAGVMRICAGGRSTRRLPWADHRTLLLPLLERAAEYAASRDVVLAVENHIDLSADEMLELIGGVGHPALGICLDTANNLRLLEDPMMAAEKMAPHTRAVHLKDVTAFRGSPRDFSFWPSVPIGQGLIDFPRVLAALNGAGYDGLLDYLHSACGDEETAIAQSLVHMRALVAACGLAAPASPR